MAGPFRVIEGGGSPEPDAGLIAHAKECAARMVAAAEAGHGFWLLIDEPEAFATFGGDMLELSAVAEEAAREMKRMALGFE